MPEQHSGERGQSMDYKLVISEHADELLDNLVYYLLYRLKSEQAARHLLDGIDGIYDRLETNPFQFPLSRDAYLANKGYHEAVVPQMDYIVIFDVREDTVKVVGFFSSIGKLSKQVIKGKKSAGNLSVRGSALFLFALRGCKFLLFPTSFYLQNEGAMIVF